LGKIFIIQILVYLNINKLLFYLSFFLILSCSREEPEYIADTGVEAFGGYTVTVSVGEGGSVTCTGCAYGMFNFDIPLRVSRGRKITITAIPDDGYTFSGWSNGSDDLSIVLEIISDTSISCTFALIKTIS